MKEYETLLEICQSRNKKGDPRYEKRLKWELEEIRVKGKANYFLDLHSRKVRYPANQNNLLVCQLLGICKDFEIEREPRCEYGEYPDIDVDYLPIVREYLKTIWAAEKFGAEYVCNIGNYTTFGIKSALIDMARVHGQSREEVQALTKQLDAKDEEGKSLTWDAAMKVPELKKYCDEHPDVADAARRLLNRNRGMGVHAGGLIIANSPLHDLVPLVKRKDNPQASAWVEGLHGKDLQPVGLVKFDLLVISNLLQIARCCELVKKRHKLSGICAKPGQPDWSDVEAWRNDPASLAMANSGDLKCIFQFDKETVRAMARTGGVDRFEDLVAYTSLNRPGPLGMKMQERYIQRKKGRESYSLHPLVQPILDKTYGVLCYQEQVMRMLNVVGEIPLYDCELVRKAISAKKIDGFIKYKEKFIINGQKNLGVSEAEITHLWNQIESFAEYGFNLSHAVAYTYISAWLLYLKTHYPHEFYTSILSCETLSEKIKEYKMEAKIHGVEVHRLDINKSRENFELFGDKIYYGMSNIKGIGEAPAKRIVASQPYKSFEDFLIKFGTDASVLKPLLGLRCFVDRDPVTLWKFAEHFKDSQKKMDDKKKRFNASMARYDEEFKELFPDEKRTLGDFSGDNPFDVAEWKVYDVDEFEEVEKEVECEKDDEGAKPRAVEMLDEIEGTDLMIEREVVKWFRKAKVKKAWNRWKTLRSLWQKRQRTLQRQQNAVVASAPRLVDFDPHSWEISEELALELSDPEKCEKKYYGFTWIHELELSPNYVGNLTFDNLKNDIENSVGPVEMKINKTTEITSKKGNTYYQVLAEDVTGQENRINVWKDDWNWWSSEFEKGNLLRVRLQPPSGVFNTFTMEPNQVGSFRGRKRYLNKEDDIRVIVYEKGKREEEKFLTDEEALAQFLDCTMEQS